MNWKDFQRRNVVYTVDMSSLRAPWQNGPYKIQHTEQHKTRRTPRRSRHLEKNLVLVFFWFFYFLFIYNVLNYFFKKCWDTALVRSMTFILVRKQIGICVFISTFCKEHKLIMLRYVLYFVLRWAIVTGLCPSSAVVRRA